MAIAGEFLAQGLVFLAMTTRLPQVQAKFGLASLAVSSLGLIVVVMAGVGSVLSELMAARRGSALGLRRKPGFRRRATSMTNRCRCSAHPLVG